MPNIFSPNDYQTDWIYTIPYDFKLINPICDTSQFVKCKQLQLERTSLNNDTTFFRFRDYALNITCSVVELQKYGSDCLEIKNVWTRNPCDYLDNYRRKGLTTMLYNEVILQTKYKLLSGGVQSSPGSQELWNNLSLPDTKKYILNIETNEKNEFSQIQENEIWSETKDGDKRHIRIILELT